MSAEKLSIDQINKLLSKLTSGTLTEAERWSLERASLDDPFLADAMDGYYTEGSDRKTDLDNLKAKITKKETGKKRKLIPWKWMSAAACLLVLMGLSLWMYKTPITELQNASAPVAIRKMEAIAKDAGASADYKNSEKRAIPATRDTIATAASKSAFKGESVAVAKTSKRMPDPAPTPRAPIAADRSVPQKPVPTKVSRITEEKAIAKTPTINDKVPEIPIVEEMDLEEESAVVSQDAIAVVKQKTSKSADLNPREAIEVASKTSEKSEANDDLLIDHSHYNMLPPEEMEVNQGPAITTSNNVQLLNESGQVLSGVEILDLDNNSLGNSDANGNFLIPQEQPYVIASFAGYDSLTIAAAPNLSVSMKSTSEMLSQPHQRLVDQMDDAEVIHYYTNQLNDLFSRYWPLCTDRSVNNDFFTGVSIYLTVENSGNLAEPAYFRDLDANCKEKISQVLRIVEDLQIFYSARPIRFMYRVNI